MTTETPIVEIADVHKQLDTGRLLRIRRLRLAPRDTLALFGFDRVAAEAVVHLLTGALLPDRGEVLVAGRNTRDIRLRDLDQRAGVRPAIVLGLDVPKDALMHE